MGKKKIAVLDLSQSDSPKLKASGTRSQKTKKTEVKAPEVAVPVKEPAKVPNSKISKSSEPEKSVKTKNRVKHGRSKRYQEAKKLVDKTHQYPTKEAVELLKKVSTVKFDASVELHLNLSADKLSGELELPHGTGKTQKVEIANDKTIAKLNDGVIDFDVLIAEPKMMPKLAKYAKLLGPKGLMPNPKSGTISDQPEAIAKKLAGGTTRYKSEPKAPLMHLVVGKLSFKDNQLEENITKTIKTVLPSNITSGFICSSMSPSVRLLIK